MQGRIFSSLAGMGNCLQEQRRADIFKFFLCPRRLPLVPVLPSAKFSDAKLILSLIQIPSSCNLSHSTQNIEQDHLADLSSTIWSSSGSAQLLCFTPRILVALHVDL